MGLPTVAFETPANREILGDHGLYAPLGNAAALADDLLYLLAHQSEAAARGRALRQRAVRQLSWDARIDDLLRVYSRLLAVPVSGVAPTLPPTGGPSYVRTTHTTGDGDD
jgi:glycosyltransferase involved in cell wall biosynthesis